MFGKVREEIANINANLNSIEENLKRKYVKSGYEYLVWDSRTVNVWFSLNYHDWLKLQKTKKWKSFLKRLRKYQDEYNLGLINEGKKP